MDRKEQLRRKKEEGRRKKEEGRIKNIKRARTGFTELRGEKVVSR